MQLLLTENAFKILKGLSKTIKGWQALDEIKDDKDICRTIKTLIFFWVLQTIALDKNPDKDSPLKSKIESEEEDIKKIIVLLRFLLKLQKKNQKKKHSM